MSQNLTEMPSLMFLYFDVVLMELKRQGLVEGKRFALELQIKDKTQRGLGDDSVATEHNSAAVEAECNEPMGNCSLLDDGDEDDEGGDADNEILFNLNVDGLRKLNSYVCSLDYCTLVKPVPHFVVLRYAHSAMPATVGVTQEIAPVRPSLIHRSNHSLSLCHYIHNLVC